MPNVWFEGDAMRLYVSGPVSGKTRSEAVGDFERAAKLLVSHGYATSVPTRFVEPTASHATAMRKCIAELLRCDGLAMLPGWRRSAGACLEVAVATACGMDAQAFEAWLERDAS